LLERLRATEETARQCQLRFDATLDNIVDGLITIDEQGIIQSYNKACRKIFGYIAEEVIGKNVKMLMPAEHAAHHDRYLQNYLKTGKAKIIGIGREVEGLRQGGIRFPMHLSVAEIKLDDGKKLFIGILRDISLQKKWEEERRLLSSLVRSSGVCIIGKSLDGVINVWNLGAERIFGYTAAEAIGRPIGLIVPVDKQAEEINLLARLKEGHSAETLETVRVTKEGERIQVALTVSPIFDTGGKMIGVSKIL
jgi:PAS domain S-box-containing protein